MSICPIGYFVAFGVETHEGLFSCSLEAPLGPAPYIVSVGLRPGHHQMSLWFLRRAACWLFWVPKECVVGALEHGTLFSL